MQVLGEVFIGQVGDSRILLTLQGLLCELLKSEVPTFSISNQFGSHTEQFLCIQLMAGGRKRAARAQSFLVVN